MSRGRPCTLLVVEDDLDVSEGIVSLLEDEGYRVLSALDGLAGLRALRANPTVDLVLLDVTMPRMGAAEFRAVQRQEPAIAQVPVVLMSAGLDAPKLVDALGAIGFIGKPFKPPALIETVSRLLELHAVVAAEAAALPTADIAEAGRVPR